MGLSFSQGSVLYANIVHENNHMKSYHERSSVDRENLIEKWITVTYPNNHTKTIFYIFVLMNKKLLSFSLENYVQYIIYKIPHLANEVEFSQNKSCYIENSLLMRDTSENRF